jgi:signal transduction histidine kinase/CheY-like chemotaxis protein
MENKTYNALASERLAVYNGALNESLEIFVSHAEETINDVMSNGLKPIAEAASLDRIIVFRVWSIQRNEIGEIYRWDKAKGGSAPIDEVLKVMPITKEIKNWIKMMADGSCITLKRSEFTEGEAAFLSPRGVKSILIAPVFTEQKLWGVITFHDNTNERDFDDDCKMLLRSAARLCANALIREEKTRSAEQAAETLRYREKMLDALNEAAIMFLAQYEESFEDMMTKGLRPFADVMDLDRISVWRNFETPDGLHASQVYRWSRESGGTTKPMPGFDDASYLKLVPDWEKILASGKYINTPVNILPEAALLRSLGCLSLFVTPVLMNNSFWGCVFFEDIRVERYFDDDNADIMRSAALLCANTVIMHEMIERQRNEGERLEGLVAERTKELNRQNLLMRTINAAAAVLLEPDTGINTIARSMEIVCQNVDADRVHLWQNIRGDDGKLHYRQMCRWTREEYAVPEGIDIIEFDYECTPTLQKMFSKGKSLNSSVDSLSEAEREFFLSYKMQSILAVPLFLNDELWGFVSFDDCRRRRFFPEADENILRSWGMLVVGAILREKILRDLKDATNEAKNASEAKSHFIANMSHEMRTPMNVIVGLTDLLLEEDDTPDKIKETLRKINIAGDTLMGLINDVLDISKVESGKLELVPAQYDVASFLNDIITLNMIRIENKPITFKLDIDKSMPVSLFGDDLRVKQIVNNLLSNAFKYTKKGSVILGAKSRRNGNEVWISFYVSDTGIGIRAEDKVKIFSAYNQVDTHANREIEGTGLGLSITKKFVELMDGEITVESEYGKGTTFHVRICQRFVSDRFLDEETIDSLNRFCYADKIKQTHEKMVRPDLSYARVLVVDDFPTNLDVAAGMLRKYRMKVDCVSSGQESIALIAAGNPVYNAVFMDHMMPGMDGIETTQMIRAMDTEYAKNVPIIALTANAVAGNEQMFLENGFNAYLSKPFSVMTLDSVVQKWVRRK